MKTKEEVLIEIEKLRPAFGFLSNSLSECFTAVDYVPEDARELCDMFANNKEDEEMINFVREKHGEKNALLFKVTLDSLSHGAKSNVFTTLGKIVK